MPAIVACPKCKKKFKLPDNMLGKAIKCPGCDARFKTPAPRTPASANAAPRKTAATQQALAQQARALKALGVEGNIERPPDVFSGSNAMPGTADPLGNHMVQDPGFGEGADAAIAPKQVDAPDDPFASMFSNPALAQEEKKKKLAGKRKKHGSRKTGQIWLWLAIVFVPIFIVSMILTATELLPADTNFWIAQIANYAFNFAGFAIWIWGINLAYEATESVLQAILVAIIPFYVIYTIVTNWEIMKPYAFALITEILIIPLAVAALIMATIGVVAA